MALFSTFLLKLLTLADKYPSALPLHLKSGVSCIFPYYMHLSSGGMRPDVKTAAVVIILMTDWIKESGGM